MELGGGEGWIGIVFEGRRVQNNMTVHVVTQSHWLVFQVYIDNS
jgi:hypothetical protein